MHVWLFLIFQSKYLVVKIIPIEPQCSAVKTYNTYAMLSLFLYPALSIFWPQPKAVELQGLLY